MERAKKQKLSKLDEQTHRDLHKDLNDFFSKKTKIINNETIHMWSQCVIIDMIIREIFFFNKFMSLIHYATTTFICNL